ncbi:uncharacterized protein LOC130252212 [Oenanthe melanoleuca]|uniref:uncharacterized protein LOC130252212 n=1 Tax=Oenanthe melanoleuca TaxID=2939378 RepID=UPI0024C20676|nr:uncharacterized protein LOC130252212 [Oenanthe melanoleuca]XP_056345542.1 uncharacterized protein LOC130252212 [Oenanthe melanoleuca]XP_056345543.1 uncharacterized protein LOC130252212 [Oenanthe melanoleuca]XP_056345544.1 uncharacterized protein LOC130252212 [Oenanthe melanoleuca]
MEIMRDAKPWKLPPALDQYKSTYRKDFGWHEDYHSPIQAHVPKPSYPAVAQLPRCYLPGCWPSGLASGRAGKLEILAEPVHDLSCCPPLPAPALPPETEGMLALRELPTSDLLTYQQYAQDLYRERMYTAEQNKDHNLRSSVLTPDSSDLEWKSIYKQDYQRQKIMPVELYTEALRPSPVFPEENRFNESRWVTEYADSYSMLLKRLDWSSPISGQWLPFGKDARWTPRWRVSAR